MRNEKFRYKTDSGKDGILTYTGEITMKEYQRIREEQRNIVIPEDHDCFYAFSKKQFKEGTERIRPLKEGERYAVTDYGLFGTREGIKSYIKALDEADRKASEKIRERCDPREVYVYESNNHESCYEGDTEAVKTILEIWGEKEMKEIARHHARLTIDQVKKEMNPPRVLTEGGLWIETKEGRKRLEKGDHVWFSYENDRGNGEKDKKGVMYHHTIGGLHPVTDKDGNEIVMEENTGETWIVRDEETIEYYTTE